MPLVDRIQRGILLVYGVLALACAGGSEGSVQRAAPALRIEGALLDAIERERGVTRDEALALATEDALLARHLNETDARMAGWIERVVLARQLLGSLVEQAKAGGPPTDAEVQAITRARFWELDRPRMVRVMHAVVLSTDENVVARSLAERIAEATAKAANAAAFETAARAVPAGDLTVRVESLAPVTLDGRAVDPARPPPAGPSVQQYDATFAAAAHRLERPGQQSPVVRSPFGYHVIYLIASIEPKQPSLDERRALLHDEIMGQRASVLSKALLDERRRELAPEQSRAALSVMQVLGGSR